MLETANMTKEIIEILQSKKLPPQTIFFIDIDDTIITPVSKAFRLGAIHNLIDKIKKHKESHPNYEKLLSNWRLQRKVMLIDPKWPEVLGSLKKSFSVYGLTKMDTGRFGNIESVEDWRYRELLNMGIKFTQNSPTGGKIPQYLQEELWQTNTPCFYHGIFLTGSGSKVDVLSLYKDILNISSIVLIDDREEHLNAVEEFCLNHKIEYKGIRFTGAQHVTPLPDLDVVEFQEEYLLKHMIWLEDDIAEKMLRES